MPEEWHHHAAKLNKWREMFGPECVRSGFSDYLKAGARVARLTGGARDYQPRGCKSHLNLFRHSCSQK